MLVENILSSVLTMPATFLLTLVFTLIVIFVLLNHRKNAHLVEFAKSFPGPKTVPYFGNSLDFLRGGEVLLKKSIEYGQNYGTEPFRLWIGSKLFIVLSAAEDLEVIFSQVLAKPEMFNKFGEVFGDSIFTLPVEEMKRHRKVFSPIYNSSTIVKFIPTIDRLAVKLRTSLTEYSIKGEQFNAWDYLPFTTFDVVSKTTMDLELNHKDKEMLQFHEVCKRGLHISCLRMMCPFAHNKWLDRVFFQRQAKNIQRTVINFIKNAIEEKVKEMKDSWNYAIKSPEESVEGNVLHAYLNAAYQLSLKENDPSVLHNEMLEIIAAGTDTTAILISYTLIILAVHTDIQDKVYDELRGIREDTDGEIDQDDIKRMSYLEQVIKEALRTCSLLPYIYRYTERDIRIRNRILPAGTNIMLFLFGTHYNSKYYPQPWTFNPDNFSSEAISSRPKCTFVPFAAGPRNCLGQTFAMTEMKIILSRLVRKYKFSTIFKPEDVKFELGFLTTLSHNNYPLFVKERPAHPK